MNLATVDDPYLNGNARLDCSDETAAQIDEAILVAFSISLAAPVVTLPKTISSAARPATKVTS